MDKREKQILKDIGKIVECIEGIHFSDREAWKGVLSDLKAVSRHIPSTMPEVMKVLGLCREVLMYLTETSAKGSISLVEAVSEGLIASEDYLAGGNNGEAFLKKAGAALEAEIKELRGSDETNHASPVEAPGPGEPEMPEGLTLNDAAALLVQVEPDDEPAMTRVMQSFQALAEDTSYPESVRTLMAQAATKGQALLEADVSDTDAVMAEINGLVEKAVQATAQSGQEGSDAGPGSASLSGGGPGAAEEKPPHQPATVAAPGGDAETPQQTQEFEALPEDADTDLIGEFITESADLIEAAEEALLALETDPEDVDAVGTVFRAFHTVKGVSAFLELMAISELAHHAESLLSRVRDKEIRYSGGYADLALRSLDMIKHMIQLVQGALEGNPLYKPDGYDELMQVLVNPEAAGVSDEYAPEESQSPRIGDFLVAGGKADRAKVEEAASLEGEDRIGVKMIKSKAAKVEDVAQALRTQRTIQGKHVVDASVRVSTTRLDRLVDMVGELVIAHSMVAQDEAVVASDNYDLSKKVSQTSKIVRELQTLGMSMRMVPLKGTFTKMTRLVRDVSRKVGKQVNLITDGEETEIDRNMVDVINDPLMHMVRNSVDHGIESPEEREKAGKPQQGVVRLAAYHAAGSVVVEIEDDGRGLNADTILTKAREKGLVGTDATLSQREIFNLIFEPGFSTAKTVTDVSGRGVGMDVVKKNIDSLRGQVEIESEWGKGSIFRMRLPLTLAIIDGMVVRVGDETYIIPTGSIVRSIKPEKDDLSTVLNRGEMLSLQGNLLPVFRLGSLFNSDEIEEDQDHKLVVVVEDDKRKQAGLVIDDLVGRQQIVIKSLGEGMKDIPGISGGAIMPNGEVGLILDVGGVVKLANSGNGDRLN
ncbi:MAG: chemotaxis protein CheW [Desulfobacteraceae bacterium]